MALPKTNRAFSFELLALSWLNLGVTYIRYCELDTVFGSPVNNNRAGSDCQNNLLTLPKTGVIYVRDFKTSKIRENIMTNHTLEFAGWSAEHEATRAREDALKVAEGFRNLAFKGGEDFEVNFDISNPCYAAVLTSALDHALNPKSEVKEPLSLSAEPVPMAEARGVRLLAWLGEKPSEIHFAATRS